ncbi:carbohydrate ABC transporter permease [uncultured Sphaerochaeta sp.]|uniref:carbohydrate ABC transporter permease n=1 Tax=uncultured Sphaerochaeta sp. TaxID=886478 RepID=UPI002A0A1411|nr:carbohydrate ABC transporter permease [uncultured Sphaerochaeta sp.]
MRKSHEILSSVDKARKAALIVLLSILAVVAIFPVVYITLGSFKSRTELLIGGANIFPSVFHFENYVNAWKQANFAIYTGNSIIIASGVMILSLFFSTMAGYVFSRTDFPGKKLIFGTFVMFLFINVGSVSIRPLFELATKTHMNRSLISVILFSAGMGQATYIFLARGYVNSVPKELDEASKIDGCSFFGTFWRVIVPVLQPLIATIALLSFRQGWNEYILPLVFTMTNDKMRPLTVGVNMLKNSGDGAASWEIMFAGATIAVIPMIIVYVSFSKYFMNGSTSGAVKG